MCISQQLRLLNGRIIGDLFGKYTCYKPVGASVVEYAIVSESALNQVLYFRVMTLYQHCQIVIKKLNGECRRIILLYMKI